MAKFQFDETVPLSTHAVDSAALGPNAQTKFGQKDINKAVKLAGADNYVLAADGNDLEAVVQAVAPHTVNNGFSFGSVQKRFNHLRVINKNASAALAVGDAVVCAAQAALGTAQAHPHVKSGAGVLFKWRVKSLLGGTGAVDSVVLIEPITR